MKIFSAAVCLLAASASISVAQIVKEERKSLGTFGNWKTSMITYKLKGSLPKGVKRASSLCSATTSPIRRDPVLRGDDSELVLTYVGGSPITLHVLDDRSKPAKAVSIALDGKIHSLGEGQLGRHQYNKKITAEMRKSKVAKITSLLSNGSKIVLVYSLDGINRALSAIRKACGTR